MARITTLQQCVDWALSGCKTRDAFVIGTEYERLCIGPDNRPLPFAGDVSIQALFQGLEAFGWKPKKESGQTVAMLRGKASLTLEPAGQFELSGAPLANVSAMVAERDQHLEEIAAVATKLGVRFVYTGLNPLDTPQTAPHMPKERYVHMRRWMPTVGSLGLDMMHLTCTVQANIDYSDEFDAMTAFRLGYLATPVMIALFANSRWWHGNDTGKASMRAHIWTDVDAARCQPGPWVFEKGRGMIDYVNWAAGVPMYFLENRRPDGSVELLSLPRGFTFLDLIQQGFDGRQATLADWEGHVGTLFPDVRLKKHLEIRAADCVPPDLLPALPALVEGLFYDATARNEALTLLRDGDATVDRGALRAAACNDGLAAEVGSIRLRDWSNELLEIAVAGVERLVEEGREEAVALGFLTALQQISRGATPPLHEISASKLSAAPNLGTLAEP